MYGRMCVCVHVFLCLSLTWLSLSVCVCLSKPCGALKNCENMRSGGEAFFTAACVVVCAAVCVAACCAAVTFVVGVALCGHMRDTHEYSVRNAKARTNTMSTEHEHTHTDIPRMREQLVVIVFELFLQTVQLIAPVCMFMCVCARVCVCV